MIDIMELLKSKTSFLFKPIQFKINFGDKVVEIAKYFQVGHPQEFLFSLQ